MTGILDRLDTYISRIKSRNIKIVAQESETLNLNIPSERKYHDLEIVL